MRRCGKKLVGHPNNRFVTRCKFKERGGFVTSTHELCGARQSAWSRAAGECYGGMSRQIKELSQAKGQGSEVTGLPS